MIYKKKRKGICFISVLQIYELYFNLQNFSRFFFEKYLEDIFQSSKLNPVKSVIFSTFLINSKTSSKVIYVFFNK